MPEAPPAFQFSALLIAGPTGVGKSALAVEVAERCGGEIVGADAFQVYAGLDLLTAKPSPAALARVPHHLIGEIPLAESFDVARYARLAAGRMREIRARGRQPVVVGGTGLYLRALLRGLAELPPADAALRSELGAQSLGELQERLRRLDPEGAAAVDLQNPRRVLRALEVRLLTGKSFASFREEWSAETTKVCAGVWLDRGREDLQAHVDRRVEEMFANGVEEEVRAAGATGPTAGQALGLAQVRAVLAGSLPRAEATRQIQQATRQYAKRQRTWFRREPNLRRILLGPETSLDEGARQILEAVAGPGGSVHFASDESPRPAAPI